MDIVTWLRSQLDADEKIARAATPGPWTYERAFSTWFVVPGSADTVAAGNVSRLKPGQRADATHIAANDPAHVLRTVAAHRAILAGHEPTFCNVCGLEECHGCDSEHWPCTVVRALASIYEDRAGYNSAWRPET